MLPSTFTILPTNSFSNPCIFRTATVSPTLKTGLENKQPHDVLSALACGLTNVYDVNHDYPRQHK